MKNPNKEIGFSRLGCKMAQPKPDLWVFGLEGSIDSTTSEELQRAVGAVVGVPERNILLDLAGVKYISSMGLGALMSLFKKSKETGSRLAVYDTQIPVKRVLQISRLDFLELDPPRLEPQSPFYEFVSSQEPERVKRRQKLEDEKRQREKTDSGRRRLRLPF